MRTGAKHRTQCFQEDDQEMLMSLKKQTDLQGILRDYRKKDQQILVLGTMCFVTSDIEPEVILDCGISGPATKIISYL